MHSGSKWPNLQIGPILDKKFSKVQHFFVWIYTRKPKIVPESSISLVFKTTLYFFWSGFLVTTVRFSSPLFENLTGVTWKPDKKIYKVVLETRDTDTRIQSLFLDFMYLITKSVALLNFFCPIFFDLKITQPFLELETWIFCQKL